MKLFRYGHQAQFLKVVWIDEDTGLHKEIGQGVKFPHATVQCIQDWFPELLSLSSGQKLVDRFLELKKSKISSDDRLGAHFLLVKTSNKHATGTMKNATGIGEPGEVVKNRPHLGDIILQKYEGILHTGFEDLKQFELIDRLEKPVLDFIFSGNKKTILELYEFLSGYPYAFTIRTKKGFDLWSLPERGVRNAYVFISRFPKLIKFIQTYELEIPDDLWGVIFGYSLPEVHQFTYDWDTWIENQKRKNR